MTELIVVAEDDPSILAGLTDLLSLEGFEVLSAKDGSEALDLYKASQRRPDLILLDVMMPMISGYDVCRRIRQNDKLTPIIMLTAKGEQVDKVVGLELGADDYVVKPFGTAELLARVRSALRRAALARPPENEAEIAESLVLDDARVDFRSMTGEGPQGAFSLTPKEMELLRYFVANPNRVISRDTLLEAVWQIDADCDITTRSVDQHMVRLRQKLERDPAKPEHLLTAHGAGYRFVP